MHRFERFRGVLIKWTVEASLRDTWLVLGYQHQTFEISEYRIFDTPGVSCRIFSSGARRPFHVLAVSFADRFICCVSSLGRRVSVAFQFLLSTISLHATVSALRAGRVLDAVLCFFDRRASFDRFTFRCTVSF